MKREFVEVTGFRRRVDQGGPQLLRRIQAELLERMERGVIIRGTGGIRKLRLTDAARGKGRRGGLRVIYLDLPKVERTYLLGLFGKGEKEDISADERKILRRLASQLKKEARENG